MRSHIGFQIGFRQNYFLAAALALNSSLIFSISTDFATGLKFCTFKLVLLRADFALSLRPFLFKRVTDITFAFKGCKNKQVLQFIATDSQNISNQLLKSINSRAITHLRSNSTLAICESVA